MNISEASDKGEFVVMLYEAGEIDYATAHALILEHDPIYETVLIAAQSLLESN